MARERAFRETVEALKSSTKPLRGGAKLAAALDTFGIEIRDTVCLDVGASTGGFTTVLLERGARRVYAVDVGHGQLLGSLRQNVRVVNLEATNVADLDLRLVPEAVDVVTVDVSYLALREAVAQLDRINIRSGAVLIGLVKPMFELGLPTAPTRTEDLDRAIELARAGLEGSGWRVGGLMHSPVRGAKGAIEGFVNARLSDVRRAR